MGESFNYSFNDELFVGYTGASCPQILPIKVSFFSVIPADADPLTEKAGQKSGACCPPGEQYWFIVENTVLNPKQKTTSEIVYSSLETSQKSESHKPKH